MENISLNIYFIYIILYFRIQDRHLKALMTINYNNNYSLGLQSVYKIKTDAGKLNEAGNLHAACFRQNAENTVCMNGVTQG